VPRGHRLGQQQKLCIGPGPGLDIDRLLDIPNIGSLDVDVDIDNIDIDIDIGLIQI
jgi:hypothetical protein